MLKENASDLGGVYEQAAYHSLEFQKVHYTAEATNDSGLSDDFADELHALLPDCSYAQQSWPYLFFWAVHTSSKCLPAPRFLSITL